jgi:hypothetical protein
MPTEPGQVRGRGPSYACARDYRYIGLWSISRSQARAILYAMNTQAVNGEKGKGNFKPEAGAASPERLGPLFVR